MRCSKFSQKNSIEYLSCEPLLKEGCGFAAFHAPADGVHHAATEAAVYTVEREPIRNMEIERQAFDVQIGQPGAEKTLLKDQAQHFFPKERYRAGFPQVGRNAIAGFQDEKIALSRRIRKFVEIENAFYVIQREVAIVMRVAVVISHAVGPKRHIRCGNPLRPAGSADLCGVPKSTEE